MKSESHKNAKRNILSLVSFILLVVISLTFISALPSLEGNKSVSPNVLNVGDIATITLTVSGTGTGSVISTPLDLILVFDNSCSMGEIKLSRAKDTAYAIIDELNPVSDRLGLVSFNRNPTPRNSLTSDYASVRANVGALTTCRGTNIGEAIKNASEQFTSNSNMKVIVLISDGLANLPEDARAYARSEARNAAAKNITIYTIGIGSNTNVGLMETIATIGNGLYWHYPATSDPHTIVDVAGFLMDDINNNELTVLSGKNIVITDVLASGVFPTSLPNGCVYDLNTRKITCNAGSLVINETKSFSFNVYVSNSTLTSLNEIAYVNYTNYLGNNASFILISPNVTIFTGNTTCINCNNTNTTNGTIDTILPNVTLVSPNTFVYNTSLILLNISAVDNVAIDDIWYELDGNRFVYLNSSYLNLTEGYHTIIAYANDSSGNLDFDGLTFLVNYSSNGSVNNNTTNGTNYTGNTTVTFTTNGTSTNTTHVHNSNCGHTTRAPVNDFDYNETADSISMDDNFVVGLNYVNSSEETGFSMESYLSGKENTLIFNMILLIAIIMLLLIIVLVGKKN